MEGTPATAAGGDLIEALATIRPAAAELGVYSVSAAPLAVPSARLGALCAYDREPEVRQSVVRTTLEVAEALTQLLLMAQRTDLGAMPNTALFGMFEGEAAVHQAAGLISVQCGCSIADAMALLAGAGFRRRPVGHGAREPGDLRRPVDSVTSAPRASRQAS